MRGRSSLLGEMADGPRRSAGRSARNASLDCGDGQARLERSRLGVRHSCTRPRRSPRTACGLLTCGRAQLLLMSALAAVSVPAPPALRVARSAWRCVPCRARWAELPPLRGGEEVAQTDDMELDAMDRVFDRTFRDQTAARPPPEPLVGGDRALPAEGEGEGEGAEWTTADVCRKMQERLMAGDVNGTEAVLIEGAAAQEIGGRDRILRRLSVALSQRFRGRRRPLARCTRPWARRTSGCTWQEQCDAARADYACTGVEVRMHARMCVSACV